MGRTGTRWRVGLRRELTLLVALKVAALALLWWLFFSPAHRVAVDAEAAGRRFGVQPRTTVHGPHNRAAAVLQEPGAAVLAGDRGVAGAAGDAGAGGFCQPGMCR